MSKTAHFLAETAKVDEAAIQPLPGSRKVYVEGVGGLAHSGNLDVVVKG